MFTSFVGRGVTQEVGMDLVMNNEREKIRGDSLLLFFSRPFNAQATIFYSNHEYVLLIAPNEGEPRSEKDFSVHRSDDCYSPLLSGDSHKHAPSNVIFLYVRMFCFVLFFEKISYKNTTLLM